MTELTRERDDLKAAFMQTVDYAAELFDERDHVRLWTSFRHELLRRLNGTGAFYDLQAVTEAVREHDALVRRVGALEAMLARYVHDDREYVDACEVDDVPDDIQLATFVGRVQNAEARALLKDGER